MRYVPGVVIGGVAVLTAAVVFGLVRWQGARSATEAGFWFAPDAFELSAHDESRIGGPLSDAEREMVALVAREELAKAFSGLRVVVTDNRSAFWRMEVRKDTTQRRRYLPSSAVLRLRSARRAGHRQLYRAGFTRGSFRPARCFS